MRNMAGLLLLALFIVPAWAHSPLTATGSDRAAALLSLLLLCWLWWMYWSGSRHVSAERWRVSLFHGTAVLTLLTVLGPLDHWAEHSSAAHMTQHMVMVVVIAPLFALARPMPQYFAASGTRGRQWWQASFAITRSPMFCAWLHGAVIWFWHLPPFYMLALENPWLHVFEHACFLVTALWFWWAVLHGSSRNAPFALLALLFTLMHTGFLGALLTFANAPWYPREAQSLQDQQLAGLIMWVMGGVPYILGSFYVGARWYRRLEDRLNLSDSTLRMYGTHDAQPPQIKRKPKPHRDQ